MNERLRLFQNDEALFLEKKKRYIEISRMSREIRALHEKMKLTENQQERADIVKKLKELDLLRQEYFHFIDTATSLE